MKVREAAYQHIRDNYLGKIEIIDNYHHEDAPESAGRLWHLGRSIQQMEEADAVYFCPGWMNYKGCLMEWHVAVSYGLKVLE